jgi:chromosome segregation ATPase
MELELEAAQDRNQFTVAAQNQREEFDNLAKALAERKTNIMELELESAKAAQEAQETKDTLGNRINVLGLRNAELHRTVSALRGEKLTVEESLGRQYSRAEKLESEKQEMARQVGDLTYESRRLSEESRQLTGEVSRLQLLQSTSVERESVTSEQIRQQRRHIEDLQMEVEQQRTGMGRYQRRFEIERAEFKFQIHTLQNEIQSHLEHIGEEVAERRGMIGRLEKRIAEQVSTIMDWRRTAQSLESGRKKLEVDMQNMKILLKAEKQRAGNFLKALVHDEVPTEDFKNLFDEVLHAEGRFQSELVESSAARRAILELILNNDILEISQGIALFEELYPFRTDYPQAVREAAKVLISHPLGFQIVANKVRMEFGNSWAPMDQLSDIPYSDPRSVLEWGGTLACGCKGEHVRYSRRRGNGVSHQPQSR